MMDIEDQEFLKELLIDFKKEAFQRLTRVENLLLSYTSGQKEIAAEIKRELHTLKGSSGMLNLDVFSKVVHRLEDLFLQVENRKFEENILSIFLEGTTLLKEYIEEFSSEVEKKLRTFLSKIEDYKLKEDKTEKVTITNSIEKKKEVLENFNFRETKYLSIELKKLDEFLSILSELIFYQDSVIDKKAEITDINKRAKKELKEERLRDLQERIEDMYYFFREYTNNVKIYIDQLRSYINILRAQPLSVIFDPLPAQVFKIARSLGKKINLVVEGGETQLDRRIISEIGEPILHMIRNAIDHGIELPEERKKKGKPEVGNIKISAKYEGESVSIEVIDDGKGLDIEKIKEKALSINLITKEELNKMDEKDIINLVFTPGFSTKSESTMISGRGIGMDIVKSRLAELGGEVYIESERDSFTKITLRFPITLGISRLFFMKVGHFLFGVPSFYVQSVVKNKDVDIIFLSGERFLRMRHKLIPIIKLSNIFLISSKENYFIHFFVSGQNFAVPVDEVVDEKEMVIRTLSKYIRSKVKFFSSYTVTQEGKIIPLLEAQLIYSLRYNKIIAQREEARKASFKPEILLVEDAPITRKMESVLLRDEGFIVHEASNGKEALDIFSKNPNISLIVTDLEMPVMGGEELIKRIREGNAELPIVAVTTLSEDKIGKDVLALATYIISKKDFSKREFIDKIKELIEYKKV